MSHREIEGQLADYADGRLSPAENAAIDEHVRGCDSCRGWLETYALLSQHRQALHPDSRHLAARAAGEPVPEEVVEHLESCESCWQLVAETSRALEKAGLLDRPAQPTLRRTPYWIAAAAMLLLSLVLLLPRGESPTFRKAEPWAGPAPVLVLSAVTRQAEAEQTLVLRPDQAYVAVGLDLGPRLGRLQGNVDIELSRGAGEIGWRGAFTSDELAELAVDGGLLMLYWPRELLDAGVYEVRVQDASAEEPWRRRFVVQDRTADETTVDGGP